MASTTAAAAASSTEKKDAMATDETNVTLMLKSKDGRIFAVQKPIAMHINYIKGMLDDIQESDGMEIPMGDVAGNILEKIVEYCKYLHNMETNYMSAADADNWEKKFVDVDKGTLFAMILASNFLDIQPLFDLTCKTVADMIKGKTPEQIRDEFAIPDE